jgi:hypothetical protein
MKAILPTAEFFLWSMLNPISMAASFLLFMALDIQESTGANQFSFDKRFFPLYLLAGAAVLAVQFLCLYGLSFTGFFSRPTSAGGVFRVFLSAQRPFALMIPILLMLCGDIEGNVFGFIIFPLFCLLSLVSGVLATIRLLARRREIPPPDSAPGRLALGVLAAASVAILVWAGAVVWSHGPENGLGRFLAWRADTPQYAVLRIAAAIRSGDASTVVEYADVDRISAQFASVGGPDVDALLKAISERKFYDERRGTFGYLEWQDSIGADFHECLHRIRPKRNGVGDFTVGTWATSTLTGEFRALDWLLIKTENGYRVAAVDNWPEIEEEAKKDESLRKSLPTMRAEAEKAAESAVGFELLAGTEAEWVDATPDEWQVGQLKFNLRLTNKSDSPIERVEFVVSLKDGAGKETRLVRTGWANDNGKPLSPGESRQVEGSADLDPITCRSFAEGRLVLGEVFPVAVDFGNRKIIELAKSAEDVP